MSLGMCLANVAQTGIAVIDALLELHRTKISPEVYQDAVDFVEDCKDETEVDGLLAGVKELINQGMDDQENPYS